MLTLAIDTSTRSRSLALLQDEQVVAEVSDTEQSPYSERLFRDLLVLQTIFPFHMRDVNLFAVASGPGSFTGLRVGLTAVKGWSEVYGKPIVAVSALEAIAVQSAQRRGIISAYFDARRGQVFGATYRFNATPDLPDRPNSIERVGDEMLVPIPEFLAAVRETLGDAVPAFISPNPELIPAASMESVFPGARIEQASPALARFIGLLGFARFARGEFVDALSLEANYVRRSDAETYRQSV